jgi:hypothetical protein
MVRTAAATISADALGTLASTLHMKCTRQRCQGRTEQHGVDGVAQAAVMIGDHQLHPGQAAFAQAAQEFGPEGLGLAVADRAAQHLPAPVGGHTGGDHDGLGGHFRALTGLVAADTGFAVGGIEEHIGEGLRGQIPGVEGADLGVEVSADARDLGFGDARLHSQSGHQVVDLAGGGAVHVGLHAWPDTCGPLLQVPAQLSPAGAPRHSPRSVVDCNCRFQDCYRQGGLKPSPASAVAQRHGLVGAPPVDSRGIGRLRSADPPDPLSARSVGR